MLPVDHAGGVLLVVALGELANPVGRVAGALGHCASGLAACQQPEDLPPRPFVGLFGCPVALFQFVDAQVVSK